MRYQSFVFATAAGNATRRRLGRPPATPPPPPPFDRRHTQTHARTHTHAHLTVHHRARTHARARQHTRTTGGAHTHHAHTSHGFGRRSQHVVVTVSRQSQSAPVPLPPLPFTTLHTLSRDHAAAKCSSATRSDTLFSKVTLLLYNNIMIMVS